VHDAERLKELQALPLYRKIMITQARIMEWYNRYNGNVCVSFSGGKDSTVLLHIARQLYPDIPAVFSDTGLEYSAIREFVKTWDNVDIIRPDMNFGQVITTYGYPIIGKEVAEAIYYARRIRPSGERERERGWATVLDHRREFLGKRTTSSRQAERETEGQFCKDGGARSRLETIGNRGGGRRTTSGRQRSRESRSAEQEEPG
jgi:hypothetical protein